MTNPVSYATASSRTVAAVINASPIRRDQEGRYCLNDLHRAAGGEKRHQPSDFLRLDTTKELISEISNSGDSRINPVSLSRGRYGGTYVTDDLALTYAMWVSPKFHLTVVRAFKETRKDRETDAGEAVMPAGSSLLSILEAALESERRRIELEGELEKARPRLEFAQAVGEDDSTRPIREAAKLFGLSDQRLTKLLIDEGVLYRTPHPRGGQTMVLPYQRYIDNGTCVVRTYVVAGDHVRSRTHLTGNGLMLIHRLLKHASLH